MKSTRIVKSAGNVKRVLRLATAACLMLIIAVSIFPGAARAAAGWYDSAWKFRKQITINHTLVAHDLAEFPVLISLEDKDLSEKALKNGDDILFTDADGVKKLHHEIEYYLTDSGQLIAWVNIPYLSAEKDTVIFMYYGNPKSAGEQEARLVWDKDFSLVQHLEETGGGIDFDSTSNANDGRYQGESQDAKGQIDGADKFNGTSYNVEIPHAESLSFTGDFTVEAWVNPAQVPQNTRHIISKDGDYFLYIDGNFVFFVPGVGRVTSITAPSLNTWVHVAGVFHRGLPLLQPSLDIYINGKLENGFSTPGVPLNDKNPLFLGSANGRHYLNGSLDEVRISNTARSAEWLQTSYINQAKPEAFFKVGKEEALIGAPVVRTDNANPVWETAATLNGYLISDGGEACQCRFVWGTAPGSYTHSTAWLGSIRAAQSFNATISGLNKATHYYYRAQAMNSAGMVSGSELYVLTRPDAPVDGSFTAAVVGGTQVNLSWTKGEGAQRTMIRAKIGSYPDTVADGREVYFDTGTSVSDINLTPGTTYYYRAWSHVSGSDQWSDSFVEMTITTNAAPPAVPVGGIIFPVDKMGILMPYLVMGMALIIVTGFGGVKLYKNRRHTR